MRDGKTGFERRCAVLDEQLGVGRSFDMVGRTLTIRFSITLPCRTITPVEIIFRIILWAEPAFIRVEPVITSAPVSGWMWISAKIIIMK